VPIHCKRSAAGVDAGRQTGYHSNDSNHEREMKSAAATLAMVLSFLSDAYAADSQLVPPVIHLFGRDFQIGPQPQPVPPVVPLFLDDFLLAPYVFGLNGDGHSVIGYDKTIDLNYPMSGVLKLPNGVQQKVVATSTVKHFEYRTNGNEHWGFLQSPKNYTICASSLYGIPWQDNCSGTLAGWNTTATKSPDGIDGVHYYWVEPSNGDNGEFDQPNTCNLLNDCSHYLYVRV
jgi:hypothetical protein